MLGKDKLVFDTTASPLSENDNIGAYLRSSTGTLITDTGGSLNVNVTNSVTVTATDLDIRDLSSATDSVTAIQGTSPWVIGDGGGSITVDGTVTADVAFDYAEDSAHASGDIGAFVLGIRQDADTSPVSADGDYHPFVFNDTGRLKVEANFDTAFDFVYDEDSAHASGNPGAYVLAVRQDTLASSTSADGDYASFKVNAAGELYTTSSISGNVADDAADSGNPVKVGSRAETGALTAVSDGDRADLLSDDFRRIYVNSGPNIAVEETAVSVTTTATALPATNLVGRRYIIIQNLGGAQMFLGGSGVTTANGIRIAAGASWEGEVGDDVNLFAIKASGTSDVRVLELA
jgi:hypothetical protein